MAARRGWLRRVGGEVIRRLREHDLMMMAAAIILLFGGMLADILDRGGRAQKSRP